MPCRDWDDNVRYVETDRPSTVSKLCEAYRTLESYKIPIPKNGVEWWEAHKREDAARLAAKRKEEDRKKQRKLILSRLSKEDIKILGIAE